MSSSSKLSISFLISWLACKRVSTVMRRATVVYGGLTLGSRLSAIVKYRTAIFLSRSVFDSFPSKK